MFGWHSVLSGQGCAKHQHYHCQSKLKTCATQHTLTVLDFTSSKTRMLMSTLLVVVVFGHHWQAVAMRYVKQAWGFCTVTTSLLEMFGSSVRCQ